MRKRERGGDSACVCVGVSGCVGGCVRKCSLNSSLESCPGALTWAGGWERVAEVERPHPHPPHVLLCGVRGERKRWGRSLRAKTIWGERGERGGGWKGGVRL